MGKEDEELFRNRLSKTDNVEGFDVAFLKELEIGLGLGKE